MSVYSDTDAMVVKNACEKNNINYRKYVCFDDKSKALEFERYLKVGSGYAFAKKHFW